MLLLFSLKLSCLSTYSICNTPGAKGQVSLPFTDLQSNNDMVCPYAKVTEKPGKYRKTLIRCY